MVERTKTGHIERIADPGSHTTGQHQPQTPPVFPRSTLRQAEEQENSGRQHHIGIDHVDVVERARCHYQHAKTS